MRSWSLIMGCVYICSVRTAAADSFPTTRSVPPALRLSASFGPWKPEISTLAVGPHGKLAALGLKGGGVQLLEPGTGRTAGFISTVKTPKQLSFVEKGRFLFSVEPKHGIFLYRVSDGRKMQRLSKNRTVTCGQLSPSGRLVVWGTAGGAVEVRHRRTGVLVQRFRLSRKAQTAHRKPVLLAAFLNDERKLISADQKGHVRLWRLSNPLPVLAKNLSPGFSAVSLDHKKELLIGGEVRGAVGLWTVAGLQKKGLRSFFSFPVSAMVRLGNTRRFVVGSWAGGILVADPTKRDRHHPPVAVSTVAALAVHLARLDAKRILVAAGSHLHVFTTPRRFAARRTVAEPSGSARPRLSLKTGFLRVRAETRLWAHRLPIEMLTFMNRNRCLSSRAKREGVIKWDLASGRIRMRQKNTPTVIRQTIELRTAAKSPRPAAGPQRGGVCARQHNRETATHIKIGICGTPSFPTRSVTLSGAPPSHIAAGPRGEWLVAAHPVGDVYLWPKHAPRPYRFDLPAGAQITAMALSSDRRRLAVGRSDGSIFVFWLDRSPHRKGSLPQTHWPQTVQKDAKSRLVARPAPTQKPPKRTQVFRGGRMVVGLSARSILGLSYHRSGQLVAGGSDGRIYFSSRFPLRKVASRKALHGGVTWVAHSPSGRRFVTGGSGGFIRLWDHETRTPLWTAAAHLGGVWETHFDASGELIVTVGQDGSVRLWEAATGSPLFLLLAPLSVKAPGRPDSSRAINTAAFHPRRPMLVAGGVSGDLYRWNVQKKPQLESVSKFTSAVLMAAVFTPDGRYLAVGDTGGKITILGSKKLNIPASFKAGTFVRALAALPGSNRLAVSSKHLGQSAARTEIWSIRAKSRLQTLRLTPPPGSNQRTVRAQRKKTTGFVNVLDCDPFGLTIAGGTAQGRLWLWKANRF
jgi:WD40 repeat protein